MNGPVVSILLWGALLASVEVFGQGPITRPSPEELDAMRELMRAGPEHEALSAFSGEWELSLHMGPRDGASVLSGSARSYMTLENRFLWIGYRAGQGGSGMKGSFTLGFDRRHGRYDLIGMDSYGTYFIVSRGKADEETGRIKLYGTDDDPYMASLGYEKAFAHEIDMSENDGFSIDVFYIDTRTEERKEQRAMRFVFKRAQTTSDAGEEVEAPKPALD